MSSVLLVYLFQENKSYGSKKPFAFILCCTRKSCGAQFGIKRGLHSVTYVWKPSNSTTLLNH
jgi:hypothetical protein